MVLVVFSVVAAMLRSSSPAVVLSAVASQSDNSGSVERADREAIRADIDGIYRAYIAKEVEKVRATHAPGCRHMN